MGRPKNPYERERSAFRDSLAKEGVPPGVTDQVMDCADRYQALAVIDCNEGLNPAQQTENDHLETQIRLFLKPYNVTPLFSGDPRGACVKLAVPSGRTDDWGRQGLCVPTRNW